MSYSEWIVYGYGLKKSDIDIDKINVDGLLKVVQMHDPWDDLKSGMEKNCSNLLKAEQLVKFLDDYYTDEFGLGVFLSGVIAAESNVHLSVDFDWDGESYLIFPERYPWGLSPEEKNLTPLKIDELIKSYLNLISEQDFQLGYYEIHNGG